jgi:hypothetical protein
MATSVRVTCILTSRIATTRTSAFCFWEVLAQTGFVGRVPSSRSCRTSTPTTRQYYVQVAGQKIVWCVVATSPWGHRYVKTEADGEQPNNLLALAECYV